MLFDAAHLDERRAWRRPTCIVAGLAMRAAPPADMLAAQRRLQRGLGAAIIRARMRLVGARVGAPRAMRDCLRRSTRRAWPIGCSRANPRCSPSSGSPRRRHGLERRPQPLRQAQHDGDEARRARLFLPFQRGQGGRRDRRGLGAVSARPHRRHRQVRHGRHPRRRAAAEARDAGGGQGRAPARQDGAGHQLPAVGPAGDGRGMGDRLRDGRPAQRGAKRAKAPA